MRGRAPRYAALAQRLYRDYADLAARRDLTFTLPGGGTLTVRGRIQDPAKVDDLFSRTLRALPDAGDLRVLRVHIDDPLPPRGSRLTLPAELGGGVLVVEDYGQASDFLGESSAPGRCRRLDPAKMRDYALTFPGVGSGTVVDLETGNPVPAPGDPVPVHVQLWPRGDVEMRRVLGADVAEVVLFGRWGTPLVPSAWPEGVSVGAKAPLALDGQAGTLTVRLAWPDDNPLQAELYGAPFLASWRTYP